MELIPLANPFNAPVYHADTVDSTMEISRVLALRGEPHGTVIVADFQEAGRGRIRGRSWHMEKGSNLPFTILLRCAGIAAIPPALPLRTGLAVALAIEDFVPALAGKVMIKWPNDVLILKTGSAEKTQAAKVAGILVEANEGNAHIGIGVNVAQKQFPDFLRDKAISISLAAAQEIADEKRFVLLEKILARLHAEIEAAGSRADDDLDWRSRIEERLYKKGEPVSFAEGAADSNKTINGILTGIGPGGELLITPDGETQARSFITGELLIFR
ncbi:MAG: biotin--[acetyl-CoA-carboxylase] ligase [Treponema sp.]|nr:biotin--[acetyl-CoA-carboxylase] ligase [Treponema sp.]